MAEFQFTPTDGFKNATSFPNPSTEVEAREQVQSLLDQLRDAINALDLDKATKAEVAAIILGQITDGSLIDAKLSNTAGQIKERVATHLADVVKHITAEERTAWNALKSVSGTFTDTTTSIAAGAEYTKTIPLGLTGVSGSCAVKGNAGNNTGSIVIFNTDINASTGLGNSNSSASIVIKTNGNLGSFVNDSTDNIVLKSCYIDGANLKFVFKNNGASTKTLYVTGCIWEVQA